MKYIKRKQNKILTLREQSSCLARGNLESVDQQNRSQDACSTHNTIKEAKKSDQRGELDKRHVTVTLVF